MALDAAAVAQVGLGAVAVSHHPDDLRPGRQSKLLAQAAWSRRPQHREIAAVVRQKHPRRIDPQADVAPARPLAGRDPDVVTAGGGQVERREHAALEMERTWHLEHARNRRSPQRRTHQQRGRDEVAVHDVWRLGVHQPAQRAGGAEPRRRRRDGVEVEHVDRHASAAVLRYDAGFVRDHHVAFDAEPHQLAQLQQRPTGADAGLEQVQGLHAATSAPRQSSVTTRTPR